MKFLANKDKKTISKPGHASNLNGFNSSGSKMYGFKKKIETVMIIQRSKIAIFCNY